MANGFFTLRKHTFSEIGQKRVCARVNHTMIYGFRWSFDCDSIICARQARKGSGSLQNSILSILSARLHISSKKKKTGRWRRRSVVSESRMVAAEKRENSSPQAHSRALTHTRLDSQMKDIQVGRSFDWLAEDKRHHSFQFLLLALSHFCLFLEHGRNEMRKRAQSLEVELTFLWKMKKDSYNFMFFS